MKTIDFTGPGGPPEYTPLRYTLGLTILIFFARHFVFGTKLSLLWRSKEILLTNCETF